MLAISLEKGGRRHGLVENNRALHHGHVAIRLPRGAVTHALCQGADYTKAGMEHAAILDLGKTYNKVDQHLFITAIAKWLDCETIRMIRALLGPMHITAKNDPTNYIATQTRGVPQVAPSSPVLFIMYVDSLATAVETIEQVRQGRWPVVMVEDDVLIQAKSQGELQDPINIAAGWKTEN